MKLDDTFDFAGKGEVILTINNLDAPVQRLVNKTSPNETIEISERILLPSEERPGLALYLCPDREQWLAERVAQGIEAGLYKHGYLIKFSNAQWRFLLIANGFCNHRIQAQANKPRSVIIPL
ncbi:MAG: hypothetical protein ACI854_000123 [Arenicella sp.]